MSVRPIPRSPHGPLWVPEQLFSDLSQSWKADLNPTAIYLDDGMMERAARTS